MNLRGFRAFTGAILLLLVGASFWSFQQIRDASDSRRHAGILMQDAAGLMAALTDAETGQRGYALTGDEAVLQPYLQVRDGIVGRVQSLRAATGTAPQDVEAAGHLDTLLPLVDARMTELSRLIALQHDAGIEAVRVEMLTGRDWQTMASIRSEVRSFIRIVDGARALHEERFETGLRMLLAAMAVADLLAVILLVVQVQVQVSQDKRRRTARPA